MSGECEASRIPPRRRARAEEVRGSEMAEGVFAVAMRAVTILAMPTPAAAPAAVPENAYKPIRRRDLQADRAGNR